MSNLKSIFRNASCRTSPVSFQFIYITDQDSYDKTVFRVSVLGVVIPFHATYSTLTYFEEQDEYDTYRHHGDQEVREHYGYYSYSYKHDCGIIQELLRQERQVDIDYKYTKIRVGNANKRLIVNIFAYISAQRKAKAQVTFIEADSQAIYLVRQMKT